MSEIFCKVCGNCKKVIKNEEGERVFYCKTCDEETPIPKGFKGCIKKTIGKEKLILTEVPVINSSEGKQEHDDIDWDLGHIDT